MSNHTALAATKQRQLKRKLKNATDVYFLDASHHKENGQETNKGSFVAMVAHRQDILQDKWELSLSRMHQLDWTRCRGKRHIPRFITTDRLMKKINSFKKIATTSPYDGHRSYIALAYGDQKKITMGSSKTFDDDTRYA